MGNMLTANFEKLGKSLLAQSTKATTEKWTARCKFFGNELVSTRQTYLDYRTGLSEFRQQWQQGLLGKDLYGMAIIAVAVVGGFNLGLIIGRGTLNPQRLPHSKYGHGHEAPAAH